MKKRTRQMTAILVAAAMSLTACGGEKPAKTAAPAAAGSSGGARTEAAPAAPAAPAITLIAAHVNNGESSFHYGMTQFKEKLEELSGGTMTVEIHPNGELGGDESELIEKVASNTVDVIVVSPGDLSNAVPQVDFLALPFLYTSIDHWKKCISDEKVGGYFADFVDQAGSFKALAYYMCGIRSVFCTEPINSLADMNGKKIRVKSSENVVKIWSALGGQPTSLAYNEVYSGLQNNVIDAAENDIANIMSMKFYEPAPNVTLTQHDYATRYLVMGASKYNSLTDDQKAWVDEAAEYSASLQWEYDEKYADECRARLEEEGVTFIQVDTSQWVAPVEPILKEIADKLGVAQGYQGILDMK
ncbi:MAG: TRAP transporter substrate-binding protein [Lachnospiraceae bacterium]|jgi:tripartite ATP-independent transporter DctP family solute receptor|nr:TRAP transporter substrate-binding protein [Lachnospiraceae bacterium]